MSQTALEEEREWSTAFMQRHPDLFGTDEEGVAAKRFAGFWQGAEHLFSFHHTMMPGERHLSDGDKKKVRAHFVGIILTEMFALLEEPGVKRIKFENETAGARGHSVLFTEQELSSIRSEAAGHLGKTVSSVRGMGGLRPLAEDARFSRRTKS